MADRTDASAQQWTLETRERLIRQLLVRSSQSPLAVARHLRLRVLRLNLPLAREFSRHHARTLAEEERLFLAATGILARIVMSYDVRSATQFREHAAMILDRDLQRHRQPRRVRRPR